MPPQYRIELSRSNRLACADVPYQRFVFIDRLLLALFTFAVHDVWSAAIFPDLTEMISASLRFNKHAMMKSVDAFQTRFMIPMKVSTHVERF
jgi:hypothetical protein